VGDDLFVARARAAGGGVLAFYHENMLLAPYAVKHLPIVTLTTPVAAGTLIAGILRHFGFVVVRSRKADPRGTFRDVLAALRARPGHLLGIAGDGPSGPRRVAKPGAVAVARALDLPVCAVHFGVARGLPYPAWDRCRIPLPFNRITLRFDGVARGGEPSLSASLARLQAQLDATAARAQAPGKGQPPAPADPAGSGMRPV